MKKLTGLPGSGKSFIVIFRTDFNTLYEANSNNNQQQRWHGTRGLYGTIDECRSEFYMAPGHRLPNLEVC